VEESGTDPRARLDARADSAGREGLTGTAPADVYRRVQDRDFITIAPDWRPQSEQPAWRQDFPIDWPQDQYVERRDFMKFLVLTSLAFTTGQFWIAAQNWLRSRRGLPGEQRIAALGDVPVGGSFVFDYPDPGQKCVLARLSDERLVAYSQECTHLSCAVIPRPAEGLLHCPCHEGAFDLQSGEPVAGPPRRPLARITLEIRGGDIFATGIEWRTS
jgi:nitrite reductase/ring-hydroxylating ferredoxin subunit